MTEIKPRGESRHTPDERLAPDRKRTPWSRLKRWAISCQYSHGILWTFPRTMTGAIVVRWSQSLLFRGRRHGHLPGQRWQ